MIKPDIKPAPAIKPLFNIGALLDIPTGMWVHGKHGESILLGGLGQATGVVGPGNMGKSLLLDFMTLSCANRIFSANDTFIQTYDSECNKHEHRLSTMASRFEYLKDRDILTNGEWLVVSKDRMTGDAWFDKLKEYIKQKEKAAKDITRETPFLDRDGKSLIKMMIPTFTQIDSLSEFDTSATAKIQEENSLGESGGNTIHMRAGLDKTRLLMEVPYLSGVGSNYFLMTAHLGEKMQMASGPYQAVPVKKLQHLRSDLSVKGVSNKFFFLMSNCWQLLDAKPLVNQGTKAPEYPRDSVENNDTGSLDLSLTSIKQLRSKSGPSGYVIQLIVSQTEGVLPSLTEFHYLKDNDRFGLDGNLQSYSLDIYPDVKLSRTTVRSKIDEDPKLRRALNITAELSQMHQFHRGLGDLLCTAKELYNGIKEQGYDWDMILSETRGWWTLDNDKAPGKFLSTKDLLEMRKGLYKPYWLKTK